MNDYREVRFTFDPCNETITDIAAAMLADVGFESFLPDSSGLTAYCPAGAYDRRATLAAICPFPIDGVTAAIADDPIVEGRDWNAEWERHYFKPIIVGGDCVIHSSFHTDIPRCRYDIVIDPKMAFGTGHHSTTSLMIRRLLDIDLRGLSVMDMGTGTGILAILAAMRGTATVTGIEIDEFARVNALENVAINHHPEIDIVLGDASALPTEPTFHLFIANINRNVITADLPRYVASMLPGATMLLSGFYVDDIPVVEAAAAPLGLRTVDFTEDNRWACLRLMLEA